MNFIDYFETKDSPRDRTTRIRFNYEQRKERDIYIYTNYSILIELTKKKHR